MKILVVFALLIESQAFALGDSACEQIFFSHPSEPIFLTPLFEDSAAHTSSQKILALKNRILTFDSQSLSAEQNLVLARISELSSANHKVLFVSLIGEKEILSFIELALSGETHTIGASRLAWAVSLVIGNSPFIYLMTKTHGPSDSAFAVLAVLSLLTSNYITNNFSRKKIVSNEQTQLKKVRQLIQNARSFDEPSVLSLVSYENFEFVILLYFENGIPILDMVRLQD